VPSNYHIVLELTITARQ